MIILGCGYSDAQRFEIRGWCIDSYSTQPLDSVWVTLMSKDSTVIGTHFQKSPWGKYDSTHLIKTDTAGTFIVKFARKGYFDKYVNKTFRFNPHRLTTAYMNNVPMIKIPKNLFSSGERGDCYPSVPLCWRFIIK